MPRSLAGESKKVKEMIRARGSLRRELLEAEKVWVSKEEFLQKQGYTLRPRYRDGWEPSWEQPQNEDMVPDDFEDYLALKVSSDFFHLNLAYRLLASLPQVSSTHANLFLRIGSSVSKGCILRAQS